MKKLPKIFISLLVCGVLFYVLNLIAWLVTGSIDTGLSNVYLIIDGCIAVGLFVVLLIKILHEQ